MLVQPKKKNLTASQLLLELFYYVLFKLSDFPINWTVHYVHLKTVQAIISHNIWSLHIVQCWLLFPAPYCTVPIYHSPSVMLTITLNYTSYCIHSFAVLNITPHTGLSLQHPSSNYFFSSKTSWFSKVVTGFWSVTWKYSTSSILFGERVNMLHDTSYKCTCHWSPTNSYVSLGLPAPLLTCSLSKAFLIFLPGEVWLWPYPFFIKRSSEILDPQPL